MKKRILCWGLLAALLLSLCPGAMATEPTATETEPVSPTEIYTAEDLQAMAANPAGNYILMNDLDMAGVEWKPVDLVGGSFDGNGYAILNLMITQFGDTIEISYDGNQKPYDTSYAGLFGVLRDASVKSLNLVNVRALLESDAPCFLGGIAGAMYNSTVTDSSVSGCLELRAHDRMFGVGGLAGYGIGAMERCQVDVTLICTDTDQTTRDEQFMGGAYATGFIDVVDCNVIIDGYSSEWGYAHNGGIVGMVMQKPLGIGITGYFTGNTVSGKITFFECNSDRRAYCAEYIGERLVHSYVQQDNTAEFTRDERWQYDVELRPEMCESPVYTETVVESGCDTHGYTEYTCEGCGYRYKDRYTLTTHTVTTWTVTQEPTVEAEGLSVGYCDGCGMEFTRPEEKLEPIPTETTVPTEPAPTEPEEVEASIDWKLPAIGGAAVVLLLLMFLLRPRKKGKYQK